MTKIAQAVIDFLNGKNIHFSNHEDSDGDVILSFMIGSKDFTIVLNGDDGEYAQIVSRFESVPENKFADVLVLCNKLNAQYKWLKFAIDDENDLMVFTDAILAEETAGDEILELVARRSHILDEIKPLLMRVLYL